MIRIQNIYYMLSYAFQVLNEQGYVFCATEEFENTADLLSAILMKGISSQVKRGLHREYIAMTEPLSSPKGKINIADSIQGQTLRKQQLVCTHDEFSPDAYLNRILKTTMLLLIRSAIPKARRRELRNLLLYFKDTRTIPVHSIDWNQRFHRNNQTYQMLVNVCYLVVEGLLQTEQDGQMKLRSFLDEQRMCRLYEKFILAYFRKTFPQLTVNASQIPWALDDGISTMLPMMQSDIMLTYGNETLIVDAKYYAQTTQAQYDMHTLHSGNLYQIFTYVKNKAAESKGNVSGLLLYARTDETVQPNQTFHMSGNRIGVMTLNLDCGFSEIAEQLNTIAYSHFARLEVLPDAN